jgi:hypothetical protein
MSSTKNNKLKCIVTGRQLIATKEYYARKVKKAGDEQKLHDTYICREAKNLLKQGTSVDKVRELLSATIDSPVDQSIIDQMMQDEKSTRVRRINNIVNTSRSLNIVTDPKVKQFINKILKNE